MHSHRSAAERARHALLNARADTGSSNGLQNLPDIANIGDSVASAFGFGGLAAEDSPSTSSSTTSAKTSSTTTSTTSTVSQPTTNKSATPTSTPSSKFITSSSTSIPQRSSSSAPSHSSSSSSPVVSPNKIASATTSSSLAYTAYLPSQTAQNDATNTGASKSVSGGAIGAVIAVILLVIIGIILFFVRKAYIRRRQLRRNTWGANMYPSYQEKTENFSEKLSSPPPVPQKAGNFPNNFNGGMANTGSNPGSMGASAGATFTIMPPPMTYNNPINETYHEMSQAPVSPNSAVQKIDGAKVKNQGEMAFVKCLFVPTLPDELSITAGEAVNVINAYDDGWALCVNGRGEEGMVPLECLARNADGAFGPGVTQSDSTTSDGRMSKRMSSIYPGN